MAQIFLCYHLANEMTLVSNSNPTPTTPSTSLPGYKLVNWRPCHCCPWVAQIIYRPDLMLSYVSFQASDSPWWWYPSWSALTTTSSLRGWYFTCLSLSVKRCLGQIATTTGTRGCVGESAPRLSQENPQSTFFVDYTFVASHTTSLICGQLRSRCTSRRSRCKNMRKVCLFFTQNNKIV